MIVLGSVYFRKLLEVCDFAYLEDLRRASAPSPVSRYWNRIRSQPERRFAADGAMV